MQAFSRGEDIKKQIKSLLKKHRKNPYLSNKLSFVCGKCSHKMEATYYEILCKGMFKMQKPIDVYEYIIREQIYEEPIKATPLLSFLKCPKCKNKIEEPFPISLEYLMYILKSESESSPPIYR